MLCRRGDGTPHGTKEAMMMVQGLGSLQREFIEFRLHYRGRLRYYKGTTGSVDSASCCRNVKHPSEVCCTKWRNAVITSALGMVSVRAKVILPSLSPSPPHRIIRNVLKMHENQRKLSTYLRHCPEFAQLPCLAEHAQQVSTLVLTAFSPLYPTYCSRTIEICRTRGTVTSVHALCEHARNTGNPGAT